jgi:hypothetical protein
MAKLQYRKFSHSLLFTLSAIPIWAYASSITVDGIYPPLDQLT